MALSMPGMFHPQPDFQPPRRPLPPPNYFEYLPTFYRFPKLPLELRTMIWKLHLPPPEVLMVDGHNFYDPHKGSHTLTFSIRYFESTHTNDTTEMYHTRALLYTTVCKESRDVYLREFPLSLPACGQWDQYNSISTHDIKALVHFSPQDRLCIANFNILSFSPCLGDAVKSQAWMQNITILHVPIWCFKEVDNQEEAFNARLWTVLNAFPNVKDLIGVQDTPFEVDSPDDDETIYYREKLDKLSISLADVQMIRGWEKTLPILGMISKSDMNGMEETVLRGNSFKGATNEGEERSGT
ncbi:hypothetical protein IFR05_015252 [Cadophora sp. M221]|nr:hypothetical protein IFR05_015252 [Cadophora sp. M221]